MSRFHAATIVEKTRDTADSILLTLAVAPEVANRFAYRQGQHLPIRAEIDGVSVRRTYSICSSVEERCLRLGIRVQEGGVFSNHVADHLRVGDEVEAMPPNGRFNIPLAPDRAKTYVAFVSGSGMSPIYSIVKTTLETEPGSRFIVFYGNRTRATTMFIEPLFGLKNRFPERLALHFVMSREPSDLDLYVGRLDAAKVTRLHDAVMAEMRADDVFLCGPNPMIDEVAGALVGLGYGPEQLHSERFRAGMSGEPAPRPTATVTPKEGASITVVLDGQRESFHMGPEHASVLDAAQASGLDLPYSCKGGVCSTCRTLLTQGEAEMGLNYALEEWEVERGFILTCQASPKTPEIEIDFDQT